MHPAAAMAATIFPKVEELLCGLSYRMQKYTICQMKCLQIHERTGIKLLLD